MPADTLDTPVSDLFSLDTFQKKALTKLRITTVHDLLYHFPTHYGDTSQMRNIGTLATTETAVVFGKISRLAMSKSFRTRIAMATATVEDESGRIQCVWFNQPYLAKMIAEGAFVRIEGKVSERRNGLYFSNPKIEVVGRLPIGVGDSLFGKSGERNAVHTLYPVYPESQGITSNWMYYAVQKIFKSGMLGENGDGITDPIPADILKKYNLPPLRTALIWIHAPLRKEDAEVARKRFAFEEIFFIQLEKRLARREYEQNPAWKIECDKPDKNSVEKFIERFPFEPTDAQRHAIAVILTDFAKGHAMARLLEGDVGSGKTAVAATAAYAVVMNHTRNRTIQNKIPERLQVAYMCPTEILASQHFESFIQYFSHCGIQIGLITGSGCRKFPSKINPKGWTDISRTQLLTWVAGGEISILIGTHALIQKTVKFKNLALAIIDEQHRFGTNQRALLIRKTAAEKGGKKMGNRNQTAEKSVKKDEKAKTPLPHLLSMTATPIPRTLALTIYGDLDLTLLDQMPTGRKPIITEIVSPTPTTRQATYEKIRAELAAGRQAYIICPRIDEPDPAKETAIEAKSVTEEAAYLKATIFPEYTIGILHGKMKPDDKDTVMLDFKAGEINILCATSVVEVGVNVPNATVIVIEGSERFGLAQLHQLRGRVIRSEHQAYCYVFTGNDGNKIGKNKIDGRINPKKPTAKTAARLKALITAKNGFELAEYDLAQRGAGALAGGKQWGISDIAMEALKNIKMVEAARAEAQNIVDEDPSFARHPIIATEITHRTKKVVHFE